MSKISQSDAKRILADLTLVVNTAVGKESYYCFQEKDGILHVPISYNPPFLSQDAVLPSGPHRKCTFSPKKRLLVGAEQLAAGVEPDKVKDQQEIFDEVCNLPSIALCLSTGFGKTTLATIIGCLHGERIAILCGNLDILAQWEDELLECGVSVARIINPTAKAIPDTDVLICTIEVGRKLKREQVADVGTVIYDEAHLSTITAASETLLVFSPNRLILCSATLERLDGAHKGLTHYHGGNVVKRVLKKSFELIRCESRLVPDTSKKVVIGGSRRIDYTHAMSSIYGDPRFPIILANLIRDVLDESDGRVLVLFRENQPIYDVSVLLQDVDHFIANKNVKLKTELGNQRLILAIDKKAKEGVNIPGLMDVVMTYSANSIHQPEGRVRADDFRVWIVLHDHKMHEKHWDKAVEWAHERTRGEYTVRTVVMSLKRKTGELAASSSSTKS